MVEYNEIVNTLDYPQTRDEFLKKYFRGFDLSVMSAKTQNDYIKLLKVFKEDDVRWGKPFVEVFRDYCNEHNDTPPTFPEWLAYAGNYFYTQDPHKFDIIAQQHNYKKGQVKMGVAYRLYVIYPAIIAEYLAVNYCKQKFNAWYDPDLDTKNKIDYCFNKNGRIYGVHLMTNTKSAKYYARKKEKRNKLTIEGIKELVLFRDVSKINNVSGIYLYTEEQLQDVYNNPEKHLWNTNAHGFQLDTRLNYFKNILTRNKKINLNNFNNMDRIYEQCYELGKLYATYVKLQCTSDKNKPKDYYETPLYTTYLKKYMQNPYALISTIERRSAYYINDNNKWVVRRRDEVKERLLDYEPFYRRTTNYESSTILLGFAEQWEDFYKKREIVDETETDAEKE